MRDRLIEILTDFRKPICEGIKAKLPYAEELADYLLANGVIVPPCKVGQTVWFIRNGKVIETNVDKIVLKNGGLYLLLSVNSFYETSCRSIGKTVFFTREEAVKALAERRNGDAE